MKQAILLTAIVAGLFCGLYGLFWALATPYPQPVPEKAPRPEMKAPQPRPRQVWV